MTALFKVTPRERCRSISHCEDDFPLDVSLRGAHMGLTSFGEWEGAVDQNTQGPVIEQAPDFLQLRTARANLGSRNRHTQTLGLLGPGEAQRKNWKQRTAALQSAKEAPCARATDRVDDEVDVTYHILWSVLGVVDDLIGAQIAQKGLVLA